VDDDPTEAIDSARRLFERFGDKLRDDQRTVVLGAVRGLIDTYLTAHPVADAARWRAENAGGLPL
jgi:hypothetical protein